MKRANTRYDSEYEAIMCRPRAGVRLVGLALQQLQVARELLEHEEVTLETQWALMDLDAAEHHLRQALERLPKIAPETEGGKPWP